MGETSTSIYLVPNYSMIVILIFLKQLILGKFYFNYFKNITFFNYFKNF